MSDSSTLDGSKGESALVVERLTKRFGDRVAFAEVSFEVGYGEVFGFLGPNGAGKTTTVRSLGTLIAPTSGSAVVAGIPLRPKNGPAVRSRISIMPESPGLYLRLTVLENLQYFAGLYELDDVRGRIGRALRAVNLENRARDLCGSLSKGLRQRVALARALLNDPAVLFLDEPTSGLDPVAAREVHDLIASLREQGVTIFLSTHRLEEAERLCDRVAILNTTLRLIGRPGELRKQLFRRSADVRLRAPLDDPKAVFGALPEVEGWEQTMSLSWTRVGAILRKELRDYRRNRFVIITMTMVPIAFIIAPMILLIAKALAAFVPALVISYTIFGVFLAAAALFAHPVIASAIYAGTHVLVQLLFTPLLAGWAIWVGIAVSARSTDVRAAQQLSMLGSRGPARLARRGRDVRP
jgi:ABC-2 type transport system ATP-binding protein